MGAPRVKSDAHKRERHFPALDRCHRLVGQLCRLDATAHTVNHIGLIFKAIVE